MFGFDVGIDLGTSTVLVFIKGKGVVLKEPSVVAIDKSTGRVLKVGKEALEMLGRTPGSIVAIRPLRDGVISDFQTTEKMLKYFMKKVCGFSIFKPRVVICVPSSITEVENRAVKEAAMHAGARKVELIEEPMAAAIGAGIDISRPNGNMVVDIGGGTTDIAVISLGDVVVSTSVKMAGDKFDDAVSKHVRKKYNVLIGERTSEEIKIRIGCLIARPEKLMMEVKGRCLMTGLPKMFVVDSEEIRSCLEECANSIADAIHGVLEKTPPELVGDISTNGIIMTGGGCLVHGFNVLLSNRLGINVYVADDAVCCVAKGTGAALKYLDR